MMRRDELTLVVADDGRLLGIYSSLEIAAQHSRRPTFLWQTCSLWQLYAGRYCAGWPLVRLSVLCPWCDKAFLTLDAFMPHACLPDLDVLPLVGQEILALNQMLTPVEDSVHGILDMPAERYKARLDREQACSPYSQCAKPSHS